MKDTFAIPKQIFSAPIRENQATDSQSITSSNATNPNIVQGNIYMIIPTITINSQPTEIAPYFKGLQWNYYVETHAVECDAFASQAFPDHKFTARWDQIKEFFTNTVNSHQPDYIVLQEARITNCASGELLDSITPVKEHLQSLGYQVYIKGYNGNDQYFQYITAVKQEYTVTSTNSFYFSEYTDRPTDHEFPDKKARIAKNYGIDEERSAFEVTFNKNGYEYKVVNAHISMRSEAHRLKSSEMLLERTKEYLAEEPEDGITKKHVIIAGDFNSFADSKGKEQIDILKEGGILKDSVESLKYYDTNEPMSFTFIAYAYDFAAKTKELYTKYNFLETLSTLAASAQKSFILDIFKNECKASGGILDHSLVHGFSTAESFALNMFINSAGPKNMQEEAIKENIFNTAPVGSHALSDHFPILTILGYDQYSSTHIEL